MRRIWFCTLAAAVMATGTAAPLKTPANAFESPAAPKAASPIDQLVFAQMARLQLEPVLCSDAVFVRRAYLDLIGTLPTAAEAREFIRNADAQNKRRALIDRLMERSEFADYWAMKWADILRIKAEFPVNLWPNAAQAYHRWVRAAIAENRPYDAFARELLTASGSNFRVGPANFYRAIQDRKPEGIASAVALTFMGARTDGWPAERLAGMAVFFSQIGYKPTSEWKEEHVFWDPLGASTLAGNAAPGNAAITPIVQAAASTAQPVVPKAAKAKPQPAVFPDGSKIELTGDRDPRGIFADWLIRPDNPWFARAIVNRVWSWFLGRGIIQEPDDIRPDNPPSNPELLAYLEREFIASRYDLKALYRLILNTATYQLSAIPRSNRPEAEAAFASYPLRRLDAEVLIDAINSITGTTDLYTSPIPEPFTYIPAKMPAIAIADGSITSPFLALFGRSARATGMENERDNKPVPAQWLHLLNSSHIQRKLEQGPKLRALVEAPGRSQSAIVEELYLTILSRFPTPEEMKLVAGYGQVQPVRRAPPPKAAKTVATAAKTAKPAAAAVATKTAKPVVASAAKPGKSAPPAPQTVIVKRREDWIDLAWSMVNSTEFLYRH